MDFQKLRNVMVKHQIIEHGITDTLVIEAMRRVPRHEFVPESEIENAYEDGPVPIGEGQTISQPYMVALMTQFLKLNKKDKVLEIGTGSGYQAAVLAEVSGEVYSIECVKKLSNRAQRLLESLNYKNIKIKFGDGTLGLDDVRMKFNAVLVTAAAPYRLDHLFNYMYANGRLLIPIGNRENQMLTLFVKVNNRIIEERICRCVFVPLMGQYGWN